MGDKKYGYFHNHGGRSNGKECNFSHNTPPKAVLDKMEKPSGKCRLRSEGPKDKAKAKARAKSKGWAVATPDGQEPGQPSTNKQEHKFGGLQKLWCPFHLKGKRNGGKDCPLPHVSQMAMPVLQAAIAKNKKKKDAK